MRRTFLSLIALMAVALAGVTAARQSDVNIGKRLVPLCNPTSSQKYLYYSVTAGNWVCTATASVVYNPVSVTASAAEINVLHSVTAGTALASSAVVLDSHTAVAGLKIALGGGATTSPGTSVGGLTDTTNATSGTTQNTEYTLNSVTLPASALNNNGRGVDVSAWGTLAANANAKNLKIYFGTTAVATVTGSTANGKDFVISLRVIRTSSGAQSAVGSVTIDTGTSPTMTVAAPSETDTGAIVIAVKSANTAAAAASATGKGMVATFIN